MVGVVTQPFPVCGCQTDPKIAPKAQKDPDVFTVFLGGVFAGPPEGSAFAAGGTVLYTTERWE